jgi:two-component system, OmpR family, KDP operon response regulator KdpE
LVSRQPGPTPSRAKGARVLVVDDERPIRRFLRAALASHGYEVIESATGEEALRVVVNEKPEVIILDLGLPDIDGLEVTRQLREWTQTPVIILSVSEREQDKVAALDAGADDYLTKPFGVAELTARIRVALRHSYKTETQPVFQVEGLRIDLAHRQVSLDGQEIALTPNEYDLLRLLVKHAGKVVTHRQLLHEVWGTDYESEGHLLRVNISNLRHKIEIDPAQPRYILTESGVGYRLKMAD